MRILITSLIASAFVFTACGGGGGQSSPEALAEAVAANATDPEGLAALFPTAEQLNEAMDCEDKKFATYVSEKREKAKKKARYMVKEEIGIEFVKAELKGESKLKVKAGDKKDGCTFKTDVEVRKVKMHFKVSNKDGKERADSETIRVVRLGDAWYLTKL